MAVLKDGQLDDSKAGRLAIRLVYKLVAMMAEWTVVNWVNR